MARIKHYNYDADQWEYSDVSYSIQQGSSIDYEEVHNLINAAVENKANKLEIETHVTDKNNPHGVTVSQIGAAPATHSHTKSQITDFPTSMPASDVSAWAKAATKPTYTANEVGALSKAGGSMSGDIYMEGNGIVGAGTVGFNAQNVDGDSISVLTLQPVLSEEDNSVYLYLQDEYNGYHTVGIQNVASPIEDNDAANKAYVDEAISGFSTEIYGLGTTPPTNTKLLWIDTTATTGGLKYYNGSSWVHVPVAYT